MAEELESLWLTALLTPALQLGPQGRLAEGSQGQNRFSWRLHLQLIPAYMKLRITFPDYDFQISNFDSLNLCTSKEHFHTDFRFPNFHTDFLIGSKLTESRFVSEIRKRNRSLVGSAVRPMQAGG